eukprot:31461-Pyramimonas_sp.AAC.1
MHRKRESRMRRAQGGVYAGPCEGINLEPGSLMRLLVKVYGLDDAPMAWRRIAIKHLEQRGFTRSLLEPCWWMRYQHDALRAP